MNDRFKIRAWDKLNNGLIYDIGLIGQGVYQYINSSDLGFLVNIKNEEYTLMQCTGLKDSTGKLIFEGDICKILNCSKLAVIKWDLKRACFFIDSKGYSKSAFEYLRKDCFAVIGNIYENPELLEVNKCQ